ncbi:SapC family protein [Thalassotalea sp. LPB0316]|uniref:SapC family protein n=1 Tax=Thalassotalea sp. LPB0316 TaxID=2769490 RepID=UPI0018693D6E|nr:SapC family protein [Thalassotalea sp. LPB0316]QOL26334.1 SapC family protein [Thalassotalea sp. LPB0316]
MANFAPVKKESHQNLKVATQRGLPDISNQHIIATHAREFPQLATSFPIFLIKDGERFRPVLMTGLEAGENLYYKDGVLDSLFMPQALALAPFSLGLDPEKEKTLTTCVDLDSEYVGEDKDLPLFDEKGEETQLFKNIQEALGDLYNSEVLTEKFVKELVDHELLAELQLNIDYATGEKKKLVGLFGIDEQKLQALSDEKILDFTKRGIFVPMHAMLLSLGQINRLAKLRNETDGKKVVSLRVAPADAEEQQAANA